MAGLAASLLASVLIAAALMFLQSYASRYASLRLMPAPLLKASAKCRCLLVSPDLGLPMLACSDACIAADHTVAVLTVHHQYPVICMHKKLDISQLPIGGPELRSKRRLT